ncbi:MAG: NADPH:quinone reductase [Peptostreptococcaceae bacterium]|nr:NADPH:quinone reductase [Peptostreptococcaceae bacterium]
MKAIEISEFGGPEVLKYKEVAEPSPNKNEVRVRLFAAGVNPNEAYIRTGTYSFLFLIYPIFLGLMELAL